jgi:hypothetical protein
MWVVPSLPRDYAPECGRRAIWSAVEVTFGREGLPPDEWPRRKRTRWWLARSTRFSSTAFVATMMELTDMSNAAHSGRSSIPKDG